MTWTVAVVFLLVVGAAFGAGYSTARINEIRRRIGALNKMKPHIKGAEPGWCDGCFDMLVWTDGKEREI